MTTRRALLEEGRRGLGEAGIAGGDLDARVLLKHVLSIDDTALIARGEEVVGAEAARLYRAAIARRAACEPVARITGMREFWGLDFDLSADTLVPRPDTETVVEAALGALGARRHENIRVLDLGTGCGCILIALLTELPRAEGFGVDIAPGTIETAHGNAARLGVAGRARFAVSDWDEKVEGLFDLVVSNPPYLALAEMARLDREVREHDPRRALVSGPDGLEAYRAVAAAGMRRLVPGGALVVELGAGQERDVAAIMEQAGLRVPGPAWPDLAGISRALTVFR